MFPPEVKLVASSIVGCVFFDHCHYVFCRSVAEEQRSLALGLQSLVWRALGTIPGPIIFGVIFDFSCEYWQFECGSIGNCWVYNNSQITTRVFFFSSMGIVLSFCSQLLCWIFYPPVTCKKVASSSDSTNMEKEKLEGIENQKGLEENFSKDEEVLGNPTFVSLKSAKNMGSKKPRNVWMNILHIHCT